MKRINLSLQAKFFLSIVLIVVPVLGFIFTWTGIRNERHAVSQVLNQARILARQIVMTRQWVADCGGVLVSRGSLGARGTHYFYDDRLVTPRGLFQRFTPSMVTKKLSHYSMRENMYRFRLANTNPLNPENRPDPFEQKALYRFIHEQAKEVYDFTDRGRESGFRYSVPLFVDASCLKCHSNFSKGTIGGCLSIFFPGNGLGQALRKNRLRLAGAGLALILLTILTLFHTLKRVVINPLNHLEKATAEISNGNLKARVRMQTGDEFERLGQAFNTMGDKLARSREIMEEKIAQATEELSQANQELQQLDKLKTDFIADMSHELRSPITAIKGGLDYLKRTIKRDDHKSYLALIDNNLLRLTHLVSDMLDLTRIEAGKVTWNFEENDMAVLIREVIEILSFKAGEKHITLDYQGNAPIWVEMDLERIEQVLVNLIENAVKFSGSSSRIELDAVTDGRWVEVSVTDSGIGIDAQDLETIFQKFHTLPSKGGDGQIKGTGLGLTICRKIVEAHGGRIRASRREGQGSKFTFTLPLRR